METDAFQISHNAGFYDAGDLNFEICAFFFVFAELVPGQNFVGFFCGEKDVALAVVSADHSGGDLVAYMDILSQVEVRIVGEILQADDAVGVIFEIQGDGAFRNTDDGSGQDIALVNLLKGSFQLLLVILHGLHMFGSLCGLRGYVLHFFSHNL